MKQRSKIQTVSFLIIIAGSLFPLVYGNSHSESEERFFSTFLGGSDNDRIRDVTLDSHGNIIVVGGTFSEDFPMHNGVQQVYGGGILSTAEYFHLMGDAFVAKFSSEYDLLWSTYIGGNGYECAFHVEIGLNDEVIVIGGTTSTDFPVTIDSNRSGRERGDPFISIYTSEGELIGSSIYLPDEIDEIHHVEVDSSGNLVLGGSTSSDSMFTTENAFQRVLSGESDGFVRVVTPDFENIIFSTYFGGSGEEFLGEVAVGSDDSIIISGGTRSSDLPVTENCFRSEFVGNESDNFIAKICPSRNLVTCTYFGGSDVDHVFGLSEGSDNSIVVVGRTWSSDFPVTDNAIQLEYNGVEVDGFLSMISGTGDELFYSTYYGGDSWDSLLQVNIDEDDRLIISGFVLTGEFETVNAFQSEYYGSSDLVLMVLGDEFELISYLGSYYAEHPFAQVVQDGVLYLVGQTESPQFMVSDRAFQAAHNGGEDGYLWVFNYKGYLSGTNETVRGDSSIFSPNLRNYLSYGIVVGAIVVWFVFMRRSFSSSK